MDDVSLFQELEVSLLRPEVRGSKEAVSKLLAEGFVEFGSSGRVYDRNQVIEGLVQESSAPPVERTASDFSVRCLSEMTVLVTYRERRRTPDDLARMSLRWFRRNVAKDSRSTWSYAHGHCVSAPLKKVSATLTENLCPRPKPF